MIGVCCIFLGNGVGGNFKCGGEWWFPKKDVNSFRKNGLLLYAMIIVVFIVRLQFTSTGVDFVSSTRLCACMSFRIICGDFAVSLTIEMSVVARNSYGLGG